MKRICCETKTVAKLIKNTFLLHIILTWILIGSMFLLKTYWGWMIIEGLLILICCSVAHDFYFVVYKYPKLFRGVYKSSSVYYLTQLSWWGMVCFFAMQHHAYWGFLIAAISFFTMSVYDVFKGA